MTFNWHISYYNYEDRIGNLTNEAQGVVKSKKYFPIFEVDGKKKVLKPLSKTKPLTTPYFAYSEVFWSTILHDYFDNRTPIYQLAICSNIEKEYPEKYHHGVIVDKLEKDHKELINLYELCNEHPNTLPDISNYTNYCEMMYDYVEILSSSFFKKNPHLGKEVAKQILCSILRQDQNYHYENILLYKEKEDLEIAPMLDHEFSTMFMYLDELSKNELEFNRCQLSLLGLPKEFQELISKENILLYGKEKRNIEAIVRLYPDVAVDFLERLKTFKSDFSSARLQIEDYGYIVPFNSSNFQIGQARYKENNEAKAQALEKELIQKWITPDMIEENIQQQVLTNSERLEKTLEKRLVLK